MKRTSIIFCLLSVTSCLAAQQQAVMQNIYSRNYQSLNGSWNYIIDPFDMGYYDYRLNVNPDGFFKNKKPKNKTDLIEYSFDTAPLMTIPSDWNTKSPQLFFYEGSVWFKKDFTFSKKAGKLVFLYFGAVNYEVKVYLNGEKIGEHIGGFTPFCFDITDSVKDGNNFVVVRVNNERKPEAVPTVNADWWNYGGITREVLLVETPEIYIEDYSVGLEKGENNVISGNIRLNQPLTGKNIVLEIPELKIKKTLTSDAEGIARFQFSISNFQLTLWSPENPKLYDVTFSLENEKIADKIGFRRIETVGKEIRLNGNPVFLKGISIHEEAPFRQGRAWNADDARTLLGWAKELGCNFVRLAHYPHNEYMVREAEKLGLMVWSEIPVYWTIHWENPETYANAQKQLNDMIDRDKNRCNVIIWSVANETPHSAARDLFLKNLAAFARAKDSTRLLSMAMEVSGNSKTSKIEDYMSSYVDIISFNNYLGWYGGTLDDLNTRIWDIPYNKPVFISEFGAGALQGKHGGADEIWTEEYQAELYRRTLAMYSKIDAFAGCSPWILVDFYSPRRQLFGVQDFFNRKGIIGSNGVKKQAFYVLREFYKTK